MPSSSAIGLPTWTATSLVTAGRALELIADAYAATDGAAATEPS